ncbi:MAG TPA: NTP transferase domain-containing protein [Bacteroidota bacterium]|nr:NTP transferase domain-containing protein [Bacteroidota bacterium]
MIAGIIAAGEGSRLRAEGMDVLKPLVRVEGVPLIERLIRIFLRHGVTELCCIVNEYSLEVKEYVESCGFPVPLSFVVKTTESSMHSLFALEPYLRKERFLLSTVDAIFLEEEFARYLRASMASSAAGVLAVTDFIDDENPLYVSRDDSGAITGFSKTESSAWVTGGLYVFSPAIFRERETVLKAGIERLRNYLGHLASKGYRLEGYPFSKIVDVDHVSDIATAEKWIAGGYGGRTAG